MPRYYDPEDRIGELLRQRGDIAAQRALGSGDVWGRAIGDIGGQLASGVGAVFQERERQKEAKRLTVQEAAVNDAIDRGDVKALFKILPPDKAALVAKGLETHQPDAIKKYGDRMALLRDGARSIEALPEGSREKAHQATLQSYLSNGILSPEEAQEVSAWDPVRNKQLANWGEKAEKAAGPVEVSPGATLYDPNTKQTVFTAPANKAANAPSVGSFEDFVLRKFGENPRPEQITAARKEYNQSDDRDAPAGLSPGMESNILNRLTTQWDKASAPVRELDRQARLMNTGLEAARNGNVAAGSQAVLVTFQKILDPTSVVRESEYARSAEGQSLMSRIQGAAEKLMKGGAGIPVSELENYKKLADQMVKNAGGEYLKATKERLGRTADRYKIPRDVLFEDMTFGSDAAPAAPVAPIDLGIPGVTVRRK